MDFGSILTGLIGLGAALGGGAVGNRVGRDVGTKPWQKILAPAGATAVATIFHGITGDTSTAQDIAVGGATLGIAATGVFSAVKNISQLFKLF